MARMTDVDVDFISLVTKGANKQKVQIYKADETEEEPEVLNDENIEEVTGFFNAVKSFFTGEEVKKSDKKAVKGFNDRILTVEVMDNIWRVNDALVSTMRDALNDSNLKDKESFLSTAIDEHGAYLKTKIKGIGVLKKSDDFFKKEEEVEDMKKEDLQEIIKEVVKPLSDKIEGMEAEINKGQTEELDEGTTTITKEDIKKALEEVIEPLETRINKIESFRGISKQIDGEEEVFQKSDNIWEGINI